MHATRRQFLRSTGTIAATLGVHEVAAAEGLGDEPGPFVLKGQTTLPWWSFIVALFLGAFVTVCPVPAVIIFWLTLGPRPAFLDIIIRAHG